MSKKIYFSSNPKLSDLLNRKISEEDIFCDLSTDNLLSKHDVVFLTATDFGGAGKAAYRFHKGLRDYGIDSLMYVLHKKNNNDSSVKILPVNKLNESLIPGNISALNSLEKIQTRWYFLYEENPYRPEGLGLFSDTFSIADLKNIQEIQDTDIINFHWVTGVVDYTNFAKTFKNKKIVWTLHDMNAFTGGCHYAGDCEKYKTECNTCPQLGSNTFNDASNKNWKEKYDTFQNADMEIITPSRWLAKCANESKLLGRFPVKIIPYGLPLDVFRPYPKEMIKKKFNLPPDSKVILFGADSVLNHRKGFRYLLKALEELPNAESIVLSIFGHLSENLDINFPILNHGSISDENQLAFIYSMADVFVLPSLEDNLPNTPLEALACGTPVVAFDIGGLPDIIEHLKTGYLAKFKDIEDLAVGINWVLSSENSKEMSHLCRKKSIKDFNLWTQTEKYINAVNGSEPKQESSFYSKIITLLESKNWNEATKLLSDNLKNNKYLYETYHLMVYCLENLEQINVAEQFSKQISKLFGIDNIEKPDIDLYFTEKSKLIENDNFSFNLIKKRHLPKISVVTHNLNQENYLQECIESVLGQNYPNLEFIIVDRGSKDKSLKIINKYKKYFTLLQNKANNGEFNLINHGLIKSTGEIMTFLNSKDKFSFDSFEIVSTVFLNTNYISWLTGVPCVYFEKEKFLDFPYEIPKYSYENYLNYIYSNPYIKNEGTFWKRSLWEKSGSSFNIELEEAFDLQLWTKFFRHSPLYVIDKPLAIERSLDKPENEIFPKRNAKYFQETQKILELENYIFEAKKDKSFFYVPEPVFYTEKGYTVVNKFKKEAELYLELSKNFSNNGNILKSYKILDEAIKIFPDNESILISYIHLAKSLGFISKLKEIYLGIINLNAKREIENIFLDEIKETLLQREKTNEDKYLITAIVSTYNSEKYIKGCLEDLESQSISDKTEIVVIDSNSQQNEEKIVKQFQQKYPNIKYIKTNERETIYKSWNRAIKISSGKYLTNSNTDDRHKENAFEKISEELENLPDKALAYANYYITKNENETFLNHTSSEICEFKEWYRNFLLHNFCFIGPQPMWRKRLHSQYGYFNEKLVTSGDYEFWLRISQTNDFSGINEILGLYLNSPQSVQHKNIDKEISENQSFLKDYKQAELSGTLINYKNDNFVTHLENYKNENLNNSFHDSIRNVDYFVEYKWNPDRKINEKGYYILVQKWECWSLPKKWILPLIRDVDQIWVPSAFVKESYINAGINHEKIEVIPTPVDIKRFNPLVPPVKLIDSKSFKFLFIGSILERKGINLLLDAFIEEFDFSESVSLIIKDNLIDQTYESVSNKERINHLVQINKIYFYSDEIDDNSLPGIYTFSDCFVYPFKTEGFGIHIIEAMASGLPVIVTNGGPVRDYCTDENSYLIDAKWEENPQKKLEMLELSGNIFSFEPDKNILKKLMREVFTNREVSKNKALKGMETIKEKFSSNRIVDKISSAFSNLKKLPVIRFNPQIYLFEIGKLRLSSGDYKEAIEYFIKAMKLGIENKEIYNLIAFCLEKEGDIKTAEFFKKKTEIFDK